ncbi:UDP-N-acetylmuramoyl-L-alanyl-D-glutamate--2,6-diaminopimelate ligase [Pullulanibacillus sp. KACC 23026]|uniref:UDP-N-acetylmuramoyl-L-alanyl-D-glutamate--2, 6-diaminopimelate ligase n=1 Tax=Pullulanibacillus sp. KACC 23026 TaxID=3028315 RepID=UPI0023B009BE|nr:UDP-N-acetylmuramoyl-L-alanyl-D-glutamate--2,6-diaminopimelate ligase [Pullulanibacillus sp. KACC 23026]WEG15006.1 UDP-N-acetylmuramoyl-L-alanyl-D-glutamate--2,6-diaminopimelate ligase [Pullulanibacillus sp. KACC 23026]
MNYYRKDREENPVITSIEMDSRKVTPGSLFVCIKGQSFDGHRFVEDVIEKGAVAIVAEVPVDSSVPVIYVSDTRRTLALLSDAFFGQPSHQLHLIGVTGTNGKTTVTQLIQHIQQETGKSSGVIGTIGIHFNNTEIPVSNTTPESVDLQRVFRQMVDAGVETCAMEVSSHALDQGRVRGLDFNIGVFTNLTQDHLDYHHTMENYLHAKSLLFSQLGNTYQLDSMKLAIFNEDDEASKFLKRVTSAEVLTYGIDQAADFQARHISITGQGTSFEWVTPDAVYPVHMKLIGKFSVYNVLAAGLACYASGLSMHDIIKAVEGMKGVPGRFEPVVGGQPFAVIVDYSHTPDSLENALKAIHAFVKGKIITVVGCGGDRDRKKRPIMANKSIELSNYSIFTSDNPRTEDPVKIIEEMVEGLPEEADYEVIVDRRMAINQAISLATDEDVVLIAGKGHETYQIIGTDILAFDDRQVAMEAIKERF